MSAPSSYEGLLYYYAAEALDHFKNQVAELNAFELANAATSIIGNYYLTGHLTQETITTYTGEVVFRENEEYEIRIGDDSEAKPFLPFSDQGFNGPAGDVICVRTGLPVLSAQRFPVFATTLDYSSEAKPVAAEFLASVICMALNRQQSWFSLLSDNPKPAEFEQVLSNQALAARLSQASHDEDAVDVLDTMVDEISHKLGYGLSKMVPVLDTIIERGDSATAGWNIYTYSIFNGKISIFNLGDARILDFEMKR